MIGAILAIHIATGLVALLVGPFAMALPKRAGLHTRFGTFYFVLVSIVCASAAAIALLEWSRFAFFFPVAIGTYAFALPGYLAARWRQRNWLVIHVVGQTSSYVAMCTAVIVNNFNAATGLSVPFRVRALVPMFVGTCAVIWAGYRVRSGTLPRADAA